MADLPDGVPNLLAGQGATFLATTALLTADTFIGYSPAPPIWGIFLGGVPIVVADIVAELDYRQEWAIADYPIEGGGFESYDKVNTPFVIRIRFASGGSEANRQTLLDSIAAIADSLTLYQVITPTAVYPSVNLQSYDYRRSSSNGLGLMVVDVTMIEIREDNVSNNFQNTAQPSGADAANAGNVQSTQTDITVRPPPGGFGQSD